MNRSVLRLGLVGPVRRRLLRRRAASAYAQGSTADASPAPSSTRSGAVIPGADVAAKHLGTGVVSNAVSNTRRAVLASPACRSAPTR